MSRNEAREALELSKQHVTVLEDVAASLLRERDIVQFVNRESDCFRRLSARPGPQGDEGCDTGYLKVTFRRS